MKAGTRLRSSVCDTNVVIVRSSEDAPGLECGGQPMVDVKSPVETAGTPDAAHSEGTAVGKRYEDTDSGIEVLCVKAGVGSLSIAGRPLTLKSAKALPSSD